jgi:carbon storage regulator CsrA
MLVLSRKANETITITNEQTGEVLTIMLCEVSWLDNRGEQVEPKGRLGIDAPDHYRIMRTELLQTDAAKDQDLRPMRSIRCQGNRENGQRNPTRARQRYEARRLDRQPVAAAEPQPQEDQANA